MKSTDPIRQSTHSFIQLLLELGYSSDEVLKGMDDALDQFDLATAPTQS